MLHPGGRLWLTRDLGKYGTYNFYFGETPIRSELYNNDVWYGYDENMDPWFFHALFPEFKLDPGGGPIEVRPELSIIIHKSSALGPSMA